MTAAGTPDTPRLYLNHDVSPVAGEALRRQGYDVVAAQEVGMADASDEEQLLRAAAEQRSLVSFNVRDYPALHLEFLKHGRTHFGIVLSKQLSVRDTIRALHDLLNSATREDLENQLRWL